MEGVEAARQTTVEEMEAGPGQAKVLTQMKTVIGLVAPTRATVTSVADVEEDVEMVEATITAVVAVSVLAPRAVTVTATATPSTASETGPETAAVVVMSAAPHAMVRP